MSETNINPPLKGKPSKVCIKGIAMDLGQKRRGVDMGPSAIRNANLHTEIKKLDPTEEDLGREPHSSELIEITDRGDVKARVPEALVEANPIPPFSEDAVVSAIKEACEEAAREAEEICAEGYFPIFIGGDHSISIGTVAGVAKAAKPKSTGVIWLDAHADFNTPESSPSGNVHGMPLAVLTGRGYPDLLAIGGEGQSVEHKDVVLIGLRSLDFKERKQLKEWGDALYNDKEVRENCCCIYTMQDIDTYGVAKVVDRVLQDLRLSKVERVHLSFDLDVMNQELAPGVGTRVDGGLTYREARLIMERLNESGKITSLDIVEVNPTYDHANRTARLAVDLTASLMGRLRSGLTV
jgi:arginase